MIKSFFLNRITKIHILVWIIYTLYYTFLVKIFLHIPFSIAFIFQTLLHRIGDIAFFYVVVFFVLRNYKSLKQIYQLLIIFIFSVICYISYSYFLEFYVFKFIKISATNTPPILEQLISRSVIQASNFSIYALGYYFAQRVIQQQIEIGKQKDRNALLAQEKAQSEFQFLRSQVNPHFMFNTLNMVYNEVRKVNTDMSEIVIQFAGMMRYATSKAMQQDEVNLQGEFQFVEDFLEIQKRRFKDTLQYDYKIEGDVRSQRIVPMVLFTFVENAIKHGFYEDPEFPLFIRGNLFSDRFTFLVHNRKNPEPNGFDTGDTGISIINLRKRLDAVYKNEAYSLVIEDFEDEFIVNFKVNFKDIKKRE
jgi:two-component system, LytTR family, sensor kinase